MGNKALSLLTLYKKKLLIPETFVIPVAVGETFKTEQGKRREQLRHELEKTLDLRKSYAVRSSAEVEDSKEHSYAGQFDTFLHVTGSDDILEAVEKVWASADRVRDSQYSTEAEPPVSKSGMAVIIQEMVNALWSGVIFSINPVTGRNECVIEAVQGSGELLVQDGINPERWIWHQGGWEEDYDLDPSLKRVLEGVLDQIPDLRKTFGAEVNIEWGFDGGELYYLQCRPVTTGKYPNLYANHISREVLPGMIKPLVWSINIPLVNSAWIRLLEGMLGNLHVLPEQLSKSFYYRAYFNMGTLGSIFQLMGLPRDSLESLMGRKDPSGKSSFKPGLKTMRYLPGILGFLVRNLFLRRKFERRFTYLREQTRILAEEMKEITAADYRLYFGKIQGIASEAAYYNIIIPLSMQISNRMLQRKLKKRRIPFEKLRFARDFPMLNEYDPGEKLANLREAWSLLPAELRQQVNTYAALQNQKEKEGLRPIYDAIQDLLLGFGHFSESGNDFSYTPWREDPDFLFQQVLKGTDTTAQNNYKADPVSLESPGIPRRAYRRAGRYRLYREMISSQYTQTYGMFRTLFLITGEYLKQNGYLEETKDVFYLSLAEHDALMNQLQAVVTAGPTNGYAKADPVIQEQRASTRKKIRAVKDEMKRYQDISLPSVIYGDSPPPLPLGDSDLMSGIATSPGIFEGEIVVVKGYEDFEKEVDGKILVIPFSDVGWTPLLIRAGAIVSESGGILSHASIIARELFIPAVSSVDHACNLTDGRHARIDGYSGKLILEKK